ncbi:hypothetical protein OKW46_001563 [Paraburkholderia sp. WSM4179]|nr:hypothetical protein [Paraburkholderia sp. WSM4179]
MASGEQRACSIESAWPRLSALAEFLSMPAERRVASPSQGGHSADGQANGRAGWLGAYYIYNGLTVECFGKPLQTVPPILPVSNP